MLVQLVTLLSTLDFFPSLPRRSNTERPESARSVASFFRAAKTASARRKFDSDCDAIGNELTRRTFPLLRKKRRKKNRERFEPDFKARRPELIRNSPRDFYRADSIALSLIQLFENQSSKWVCWKAFECSELKLRAIANL